MSETTVRERPSGRYVRVAPPVPSRDLKPADAVTWWCSVCYNTIDRACANPTHGCRIDAEMVEFRLEQAGATLLAMRSPSAYPAAVRSAMPDCLQTAQEAYGYTDEIVRPAQPDAAAISLMDTTFTWLRYIPQTRHVVRRIVAARSLVHPMTERHCVTWRRLERIIHADRKAIQLWHAQGIQAIVEGLRG